MQKIELIIDPPSGWMHGFPKVVPGDLIHDSEKLSTWLVTNGYPEEDIDLALKYSRYWERPA
jgi:hypothetical protein